MNIILKPKRYKISVHKKWKVNFKNIWGKYYKKDKRGVKKF